jgi:hypothetical protein
VNKEYTPAEAKAWLNGYDAGKAFAKKEWKELTATEIKILRNAATNDRQFAELIQSKSKEKNHD